MIQIRPETPEDAEAIRQVVETAFGTPAEARLVDALRRDGDVAVSLVAEDGGAIVGHVLLSVMQKPGGCLGLAPVSVAPERQSEGIGAALVSEALARATADGWRGVFVLGDPTYYGRFGFDAALAHPYASAYAGDYFQALELVPGALAGGGEAAYAPAFESL